MMQHVRGPQSLQARPVDAAPKFAWERFSKLARELLPLWQRHWEEIALDQDDIPLAPDFDSYYRLDTERLLHILTVRAQGDLVGYSFSIVGSHLHYVTTKTGHTELFWLAPEYRHGWTGFKLIKYTMRGLKQRGVKLHTVNFKLGFQSGRVGRLFKRLGYKPTDIVMRKLLGD